MNKLTLIAALSALTACTAAAGYVPVKLTTNDTNVHQSALMRTLKDPSSAQVVDVRVYESPKGHRMICSKVNGKNSFGGYSGFQVLMVMTVGGVDYSAPFSNPVTALGGVASIDCAGAGYPV